MEKSLASRDDRVGSARVFLPREALGPMLSVDEFRDGFARLIAPRLAGILCAVMGVGLCGPPAAAADDCPGSALGYLITVQGTVEVSSAAGGTWQPARLDTPVCTGDIVRVGEKSRAGIYFADIETVAYLDQNTTTRPAERPAERSLILDLLEGALNFLSREPRSLEIRTPFVNAGVKGTEFEVRVELDRPAAERPSEPFSGRAVVTLLEGRVEARTAQDTKFLVSGQAGEVRGNCPSGISLELLQRDPTCNVPEGTQALRVYARLPNAVQWALYYPPITTDRPTGLPPDLAEANRLLARGRVDEALPILCAGSARGETSALIAIIELTRNDPLGGRSATDACGRPSQRDNRQRALDFAEQAVRMTPRSAAAWVALSYARQAYGKLDEARQALEKGVEADPQDPLVHARLAEIWLSLGYRDRALEAAATAKQLASGLSRTQTVYGFAALAEIDIDGARFAFTRAIQLDSADSLPRLGLGLAKIRDGEIAAGRRELEIAAGLDPQNSLIRSYLGKAYFEEKRGNLDAAQFDLAKALDPNDPTPWLYDAIRLETENRPVEALHAIQRSIELNDNRAVYRSRFDLDEDAAVRSTSLGRIYDDLGFEQLALVEGSKSLSYDPANHSAHRFLADSYAALPRHEIARASELLQSQLLQPLNSDPVQPQLAETDLNILAGIGPAEVGFSEFTPLFQRNDLRFNASGIVGNHETYSDETVLSGIAGRTAFSIGQFHYQSDGFRPNNDLQHDIYNLFGQVALTDDFDLQFEYRHRETEQGDLQLNFDPSAFSETSRRDVKLDAARLGLHHAPSPRSDLLFSLIYADRTEEQSQDDGVAFNSDSENEGYDVQAQHLLTGSGYNLVTGAGAYYIDVHGLTSFDFTDVAGEPCPPGFEPCEIISDSTIKQVNAYAYLDVVWPSDVTWTLGLAVDSFDQGSLEETDINPKLGLQWDLTDRIRVRAAYFETLKRALVVNQTLEPTEVAGFNQFFDDINGTRARRYGVAIDAMLNADLYAGVEGSRRDLKVPELDVDTGLFETEDEQEDAIRGYVFWIPDEHWSVAADFRYERFEADATGEGELKQTNTLSAPIAVRYFGESGFFAEFAATFVHQKIDVIPPATIPQNDDQFVVLDAAIGYRFPRRLGIVSFEVRNLLDERFLFQEPDIDDPEPSSPRFLPDRTFLARLALAL